MELGRKRGCLSGSGCNLRAGGGFSQSGLWKRSDLEPGSSELVIFPLAADWQLRSLYMAGSVSRYTGKCCVDGKENALGDNGCGASSYFRHTSDL